MDRFGPPVYGQTQSQSFDISDFSLQQKDEDTEVLICRRRPTSDPNLRKKKQESRA
jgi:hypothetical protein